MRSVERHVEEEGLVGGTGCDEASGLPADQVGGVAFVAGGREVEMPVELALALVGEVVDVAVVVAVEAREAAVERQEPLLVVTEVPLAEDAATLVSRLREQLRQRVLRGG